MTYPRPWERDYLTTLGLGGSGGRVGVGGLGTIWSALRAPQKD